MLDFQKEQLSLASFECLDKRIDGCAIFVDLEKSNIEIRFADEKHKSQFRNFFCCKNKLLSELKIIRYGFSDLLIMNAFVKVEESIPIILRAIIHFDKCLNLDDISKGIMIISIEYDLFYYCKPFNNSSDSDYDFILYEDDKVKLTYISSIDSDSYQSQFGKIREQKTKYNHIKIEQIEDSCFKVADIVKILSHINSFFMVMTYGSSGIEAKSICFNNNKSHRVHQTQNYTKQDPVRFIWDFPSNIDWNNLTKAFQHFYTNTDKYSGIVQCLE